LKSSDAENRSM